MVSAGLFALLILSAGYTVYSIMRPQLEEMAISGLKVALDSKVRLIDTYLADSLTNTHALRAIVKCGVWRIKRPPVFDLHYV